MKSPKATFTHTPFGNLKELLKENNIQVINSKAPPNPTTVKPQQSKSDKHTAPEDERQLFLNAMSDVVPLKKRKYFHNQQRPNQGEIPLPEPSDSTLARLKKLIDSGEGFIIAQTPEYIEGANSHAHPELTRLLHSGHFTIQDHIDLHGLNVEDAQIKFDAFMKKAVATRKKGVLIVHGRGLSSPLEPVLKQRVLKWLSSGPWRKWVVAYTTARACDGGAGATYALLRDHPIKKCRRPPL